MAKNSLNPERILTMYLIIANVLGMTCLLVTFVYMSTATDDFMPSNTVLSWSYFALSLLCVAYTYFFTCRARKMLSEAITVEAEQAVKRYMEHTDTTISTKLEAKVERAVTDRIERSDVVRMSDSNLPPIRMPDGTLIH